VVWFYEIDTSYSPQNMTNGHNNKFVFLTVLFVIVLGGYFFFSSKNVWQGFYYPNGCLSCEEDYMYSPKFKGYDDGLADCVIWGNNIRRQGNNLERGDVFECGLNCKNKSGFFVCEETIDY